MGSINVDIVASVDMLPRGGETVLAHATQRLAGGKGANQAVAASRMGAPVRMIGAIGADEGGEFMAATLRDDAIDCSAVSVLDGVPTGAAYIAVDAEGENQIIVAPGANGAVTPQIIPAPQESSRILLSQLEIPLPALAAFFAPENAGDRLRILNAAPAIDAGADLFDNVDVLIVNQHELAQYCGGVLVERVEDTFIARELMKRPDQCVVVTLGAAGACAVWPDDHFYARAFKITPVDTIGAGDCFVGALAALLAQGCVLKEALPIANAAAAQATQKAGGVPAMPNRAAVEAALKEQA
nr:ribokinase [Altericroceibacterium endophyticum]